MEFTTALLAFTGLTVGTGCVGLYAGRHFAARSLNFRVQIATRSLKVSGPLALSVDLCPRNAVRVDEVVVTVRCKEITNEKPGGFWGQLVAELLTSRRYRTNDREETVLCEERTVFPQGRVFTAGEPQHLDLQVQIPDGGVGSQNYGERQVRWTAEVRFAIPGAPDALLTLPLQVAPRYV
jgi:hypothetical protein